MEVTIKGLNETLARFGKVKDQLPYALSLAVNKTAQSVKKAQVEEMQKVFDRPTPFTLNSLMIDPASKATLTATVKLKDAARLSDKHYLIPEIKGGGRRLKNYEVLLNRYGYLPADMYTIPAAGARMDQYGNMSRGQLVQILSYLQAFPEQGYMANATKRSLTKNAAPREYFLMRDPGGVPKGIYQRMAADKFPMPVLIFVKQPQYRPRLDFIGVGKRTAIETFKANMIEALGQAIRYAR